MQTNLPFLQAAIDNDFYYIKTNLDQIDTVSHPAQKTALHYAAQYGNVNIVKFLLHLLENRTSSNGFTALHYAAKNGHYECVQVLVQTEYGIMTANKKLAIEIAAEAGEVEIMKLLWKYEGRDGLSAGGNQKGIDEFVRLNKKKTSNQLKKSWLVQYYCQQQEQLNQQLVEKQIQYKTELVKVERERDGMLERIAYLNSLVKQEESDCEDWVQPSQSIEQTSQCLIRNMSFFQISCSQVFNDQRKRNLILQGHGLMNEVKELKQISQQLLDRFEGVFSKK